ncbi:hypothetical protein ACQR1I_27875 [Bradyrhizobium sp. HKCCYLS2038]|uniref:hypothetical protein n=1 Tax=unclassified Bradyrhizobium TaxID=2631580 RepID=UPI003EB7F207
MTNRTANLLPCVAAVALAGAAAVTIEFSPASAADECLAKPAGTPAGKHWFYRVDRTTKKQCWYLGDDRGTHGASLTMRKLASHRAREPLSSSAADAHAEIQSPPNRAADEVKPSPSIPSAAARSTVLFPPIAALGATAASPSAAMAAASAEPLTSAPVVDEADAVASESAVATRWPDTSDTLQAKPAPAPRSTSITLAAASSDVAPSSETAAPVAASQTVAEAMPVAPVGGFSDDAARTRLLAFLAAVAVAGFSISVLLARARARRQLRIEPVATRRMSRWPAEPELDHMHLPPVGSLYQEMSRRREQPAQRASQVSVVPRDDERYDDQYEVEDLLARYSGQGRRKS